MSTIKSLTIVSLIFFACVLNQAYFQGIFEVSEAREGVVVNEIKEFKTWLLPLRHGEVVPSKPPLFHWLTALATTYEKSLSQLGLRIVSIFSGLACLISVFLFSKIHIKSAEKNLSPALISTIALSSTYGFIQMSIDGRVDMLFLFLIITPILWTNSLIIKNLFLEEKLKLYIISVILALSILSRGPLALVTFYLCLFTSIILFYKRHAYSLTKLRKLFIPFFALPILISLPWYISSHFLGKPELISRQLVFENISRYFGNSNIISKPFWFYLNHIWLQSFPWGIICILCLCFYFYYGLNKIASENKHLIFLLSAQILVIFLFLSSSSGKRKAYLLAILPHIALLASCLIQELKIYFTAKEDIINKRNLSKIAYFLSLILVIISISSVLIKVILSLGMINFVSSSFFLGLNQLNYAALILPIIFNLICFYISFKNKDLKQSIVLTIFLIATQSYITLPSIFYLTKGESHSYKLLANNINEKFSGTMLSIIKTKDDESFDSLLFYIGKRVNLQHPDSKFNDGIYIARKEWFDSQNIEFKNKSEIILKGKRLTDKDKREVVVFYYKANSENLLIDKNDDGWTRTTDPGIMSSVL